MRLSANDLKILCTYAEEAATQAANLIQQYYRKHKQSSGNNIHEKPLNVSRKNAGTSPASQVLSEADVASDGLIRGLLSTCARQFDLAILTEESTDDQQRLYKDHFWCVDPLDGTLSFIEQRSGYAVSIALVAKSGFPQIGVVCNPIDGTLYSAISGQGLYRNRSRWTPILDSQKISAKVNKNLYLTFDTSFVGARYYSDTVTQLNLLAHQFGYAGVELSHPAGAVMNALRALENVSGCYFKFPKPQEGGGSVWDFAATAVIYQEAGASVSDAFGQPLNLNPKGSTFMNVNGVIYSTDLSFAKALQELIATVQK